MKFSFQLAFTWRNQFPHNIVRYLTIILRGRAGYIEDITRWREDMNFMFEWQEQYLTSDGEANK